jgi:hypothetical protein
MLKKVIFAVLVALPIAAWAFVKPVRVLAPELEGLTCVAGFALTIPRAAPRP